MHAALHFPSLLCESLSTSISAHLLRNNVMLPHFVRIKLVCLISIQRNLYKTKQLSPYSLWSSILISAYEFAIMNKRPVFKWLYIYQVVNVIVHMHSNLESDYDWSINGRRRRNRMQMQFSRVKYMLFTFLVHVPGPVANNSSVYVILKTIYLSCIYLYVSLQI